MPSAIYSSPTHAPRMAPPLSPACMAVVTPARMDTNFTTGLWGVSAGWVAFYQYKISAKPATPMIVIAAATSTPHSTAKIALLSVFLALLRVVRLNEPTLRLDAKD